jgi:hypothetical protein
MTKAPSNAPGDVKDLLKAVSFARNSFRRWRQLGLLAADQLPALDRYYEELRERVTDGPAAGADLGLLPRDVCWSCGRPLRAGAKACGACGALTSTVEAHTVRYLNFLCHEVRRHEKGGRLGLAAAHDCLSEANGRLAALRRKLGARRVPPVEAVVAQPPEAAAAPRRHRPRRTTCRPAGRPRCGAACSRPCSTRAAPSGCWPPAAACWCWGW